jgi:hypothetical protein
MEAAMNQIRPHLAPSGFQPRARVCVISLVHQPEEVTGWLVADILEGAGFDVTRSTLAVPEAARADQWRTTEAAVAVLVAPTIAFSLGSACLHSPVPDAVERLCRDCVKYGGKIILVGVDSPRAHEFGPDAHVDDFADVVPAVERLIQDAGSA